MTPQEMKALGRRLVEELFNQGDLSVADQVVAAGYIEHSLATRPEVIGVDSVKQVITIMRRAFPDLRGVVEDQLVEGNLLAERITVTGTHQGRPFMGVAGTGASVTVSLARISRLSPAGTILEGWTYADRLAVMQQLVPQPSS